MIVSAVLRSMPHANPTKCSAAVAPEQEAISSARLASLHESNMTVEAVDSLFRQSILDKYETTSAFFEDCKGKSGAISRQNFKAALQKLGMELSDEMRKHLRKRLALGSKSIDLAVLMKFVGGDQPCQSASSANSTSQQDEGGLANLPPAIPSLPKNFQLRPAAQEQLTASLIGGVGLHGGGTVSLTAPSNKISTQGMG
jgi:hypothetical protein